MHRGSSDWRKACLTAAAAALLLLAGCGKSVQEHFDQAQAYFDQGNLNAGVIELKNVLQKDQNHAAARRLLGLTYLKLGDGASAEKELRRARELGAAVGAEEIAEALLQQGKFAAVVSELQDSPLQGADEARRDVLLGDAHLGLGEADAAERSYRAALDQQADFVSAYVGLGRLAMGRRDFKSAGEHLAQALAKDPRSTDAWLLQGELAFIQSRYPDAQAAFEKAVNVAGEQTMDSYRARSGLANALLAQNKAAEAQEHIAALLKRAPNAPVALYLKALAAYQQGNMQVAEDALLRALKGDPDYKAATLLLGAVNYRQGNLEQAEQNLSKFVAAVPSHIPARKLLGATRLRLNEPEKAVDAVADSLAESPDDLDLLSIMGTAALQTGDTQAGLKFLEKAVQENPDMLPLRNQLAAAYMESGNAAKAVQELEALSGEGEELYQSKVLLVLGYLRQGEKDKALATARELVASAPDKPHAYMVLGSVLLAKGDRAGAKEQFQQGLAKQADYLPAMISLARLEAAEGNLDEARKRFEQVVAVDKKNMTALMALAAIAERLGDTQQTLAWLEEARTESKSVAPRALLVQYYLRAGDLNKVRELVTESEQSTPDNPTVMTMRIALELAAGSTAAAEQAAQGLVAKFPKYGQGYLLLARVRQAANDGAGARRALDAALKADPTYVPALVNLVRLETEAGNVKRAKALVAQFRQANPKAKLGDLLEGDVLMADGAYAEALKVYDKIDISDPGLVLRKFQSLAAQGKTQEGIALLQTALKGQSNNDLRWALAQALGDTGRRKEAIAEYETLIKAVGDVGPALNNLAWLYMEEGDARAAEYAERAYRSAPNNPAIADTSGWIYARQGQWDKGLSLLEVAAKGMPDNPQVMYHFAAALAKNGRADEARERLTALLSQHPQFPERDEAQALLERLQSM